MFERHLIALGLVEPQGEDSARLRDRLKANFPGGAARRMTLLGLMVGSALKAVARGQPQPLVYASEYGESVALEGYLKSFPTASPTLFQTSIHPSGFQQSLIGRQQPMGEVLPLAGGPELVLQSLLAVMCNPADEVLWCGGDERGTWLRELGAAADRSFAFALVLARAVRGEALGRIRLEPGETKGDLSLAQFFDLLQGRRTWRGPAGSGWQLSIAWQ